MRQIFNFHVLLRRFPRPPAPSFLFVVKLWWTHFFMLLVCRISPFPHKKLFKSVRRMDIVGALKDFATIEGETRHKESNYQTCYQEVNSWHHICYFYFVLLQKSLEQVLHLVVARVLRSLVQFLDQLRRVTLQATMPIRRVVEIDLLWTCLAWEWLGDDKRERILYVW